MKNVFVGRQPIFDTKFNVYAYELLYRSSEESSTSAGMVDGDQATTQTIINAFVEIGLEKIVRISMPQLILLKNSFSMTIRSPSAKIRLS